MQIKPYQIKDFIKKIATNQEICAALIYGPESGLVDIYAKEITRQIVPNSDQLAIIDLGEEILNEDPGRLADEFMAISMFGDRKLIRLNSSTKTINALKLIFAPAKKGEKPTKPPKKPAGDHFILIKAGNLEKSSAVRKLAESSPFIAALPCYEDDEKTIGNLISQKLRDENFTFTPEVIKILIEKFGKNRQIILNEVEKLTLSQGQNKNLSAEIVNEAVADLSEISIFEFCDAFFDKNRDKAMNLLQKLEQEKTAPIAILRILAGYLNKIHQTQISLAQNDNLATRNLEFEMRRHKIFFKKQAIFRKHLQIWNLRKCEILLMGLSALEIKCKNSSFSPEIMLRDFILKKVS